MKQTILTRHIKKLVLSALFLSLGLVLPFFTGQIPQLGTMLLPMHLPVLLCGLVCGGAHGALVGFVLPLLRGLLFGMPPIFPAGIAMAFELMTYGLISGMLYSRSKWKCVIALYRALIPAMMAGRLVWGMVRMALTGVGGESFTWAMFLSGAFFTAIPGIALQLVFIPVMMVALGKAKMVPFHSHRHLYQEQHVHHE